jgi:hypothetical protein
MRLMVGRTELVAIRTEDETVCLFEFVEVLRTNVFHEAQRLFQRDVKESLVRHPQPSGRLVEP